MYTQMFKFDFVLAKSTTCANNMDLNGNLISSESLLNLRINDQTWHDIVEYQSYYAEIVAERELFRVPFAHRSPEIHYREFLIKHLKDVAITKQLTHCTLHLCVYLMDIFMDNHSITADRLLLVANCCLLIAAKIEECVANLPTIVELNCLVSCQYTIHDYKTLEMYVLKYFDWRVMYPTAAHYVHYFLHAAVSKDDCAMRQQSASCIIRELHLTIRIYLDKILDDVHYMQKYKPSILSAALISIARHANNLEEWHQQLEIFTKYTLTDFEYAKLAILQTLPLPCTDCGIVIITTEEEI